MPLWSPPRAPYKSPEEYREADDMLRFYSLNVHEQAAGSTEYKVLEEKKYSSAHFNSPEI